LVSVDQNENLATHYNGAFPLEVEAPRMQRTRDRETSQVFEVLRITVESTTMEGSSICEFYHNRSVLVTGGTGFMGKVLVQKLLTTCDVDNIFLLVRKKAGGNTEDRLEEIVKTPVTSRFPFVSQI
jgi:FlaA1/EpsC-like NDP-sugar epimerase